MTSTRTRRPTMEDSICDCKNTHTLWLSEVAFLDACSDRSIELSVKNGRRSGGGFVVGQDVLLDRWSTRDE